MNTTRNRVLWYVFYWVNWGVILWFWWWISGSLFLQGSASALVALGRLTGLAAAYLILLQFFTIGRTPWLERTFGLDRLSRFHHKSGQWGFLLLLAHPVLLSFGYAGQLHTGIVAQFLSFLSSDDILQAAIGLGFFTIVVVTSITLARRHLRYEMWYLVHLIAYVAVFLSFSHQVELGTDLTGSTVFILYWIALYATVFASHIVFRIVWPFILYRRHRFRVERVERETHDVVSIVIGGEQMDRFRIKPGQFMILRFLDRHWWQAHPFSLSSLPDSKSLRVTIKAVGDFTRRVEKIGEGTGVLIEGPYGIFTDGPDTRPKALLIAGGIGITPVRALFEQLARLGKDVVLLYSNRTERDVALRRELEEIVRECSCAKVIHVLTEQPNFAGEKGRLDEGKIQHLVPDASEREAYVCGPVPMMNALVPALERIGIPAARIHHEKFAL